VMRIPMRTDICNLRDAAEMQASYNAPDRDS
jgi:hypothetical protein